MKTRWDSLPPQRLTGRIHLRGAEDFLRFRRNAVREVRMPRTPAAGACFYFAAALGGGGLVGFTGGFTQPGLYWKPSEGLGKSKRGQQGQGWGIAYC